MGRKPRKEIICKCNEVERSTIETAIRGGCKSLNEIFDTTMAGVGPCGGSCRRKLAPMLRAFQQTGTFPEKIVEDVRMPTPEETAAVPAIGEKPKSSNDTP